MEKQLKTEWSIILIMASLYAYKYDYYIALAFVIELYWNNKIKRDATNDAGYNNDDDNGSNDIVTMTVMMDHKCM